MIFQNFGFNQNYPVVAPPEPPPAGGIQRLAVSSSIWAYYDIAFTASYSQSGQTTVFDLSGNGNNGTTTGTVNYNTAGISGSVLRLGSTSNSNRVEMPSTTLAANQTWVLAWYMTGGNQNTEVAIEPFAGRDPEAFGIFVLNSTYNSCVLPIINDQYGATLTPTPTNSGASGSWHISQFSFNDATNNVNYCMDGITGSYTITATVSTGTVTPKFNFNTTTRTLNSGSMMQVMALYTGSLTTQQLLDNHNSLKQRYGL